MEFKFSEKVTKDYEIEGLIAQGAKTTIYKANQLSLGRSVAIKVLNVDSPSSTELHERFLREAKCLAKLSHPNVVELYDFGIDGQCPFIVEEFLQGHTLLAEIKDGKPLPLDKSLAIGRSIASALQTVHGAKVLHRDLKPANVFIVEDEGHSDLQVKLIDFGLAKRPGSDATLTERGQIVSSLAFAAPEQIMAEEPTEQSDLYALGTVLFLLISGTYPFRLDNRSMLQGKMNETAPSLADRVKTGLPQGLSKIIDTLLARSPYDRYENAGKLLEALEALEVLEAGGAQGRASSKREDGCKREDGSRDGKGSAKPDGKKQSKSREALVATSANPSVRKNETKKIETKHRLVPYLAVAILVITVVALSLNQYLSKPEDMASKNPLLNTKQGSDGAVIKGVAKTPNITQFELTSVGATSLEILLEANVPVTATLTITSQPKGRFERSIQFDEPLAMRRERVGNVPQKKKYTLHAQIKHGDKELLSKSVEFSTGSVSTHIVLASVQFKTEAPQADFSKLWSENVFARGTPLLWKGKLFVSLNDYGLFCLDVEGQKQVWRKRELKGLRGLRVFGETLFGLDKGRKLIALNAIDGKEQWSTDLPADVSFEMYSAPVGLLLWKPFVGPFCIDKKNGKYLGKIDDSDFSVDCWTIAGDGTLWLARTRQELWAYNSKNGTRVEPIDVQLPKDISSPIVTIGDKLFVGLEDGSIFGGETKDKNGSYTRQSTKNMKKLSSKLPGPVRYLTHHDKCLFAYSDSPPTIVCLNSDKGELIWRRQVKDRAVTPIIIHRQRVYFAGEKKHIHCLDEWYGWYLWKHYTGLRYMFGLVPWDYGVVYCSHVGDIIALSDA